jgi:hypothetical protein
MIAQLGFVPRLWLDVLVGPEIDFWGNVKELTGCTVVGGWLEDGVEREGRVVMIGRRSTCSRSSAAEPKILAWP